MGRTLYRHSVDIIVGDPASCSVTRHEGKYSPDCWQIHGCEYNDHFGHWGVQFNLDHLPMLQDLVTQMMAAKITEEAMTIAKDLVPSKTERAALRNGQT